MPFPVSITTITVTAKYLQADGTPCEGTVTFTPTITAETGGFIFPMKPATVKLVDGQLTAILAATDDPDWIASGFNYTVTERITGDYGKRIYQIEVPFDSPGGTMDLASSVPTVIPLTPSAFNFNKTIVIDDPVPKKYTIWRATGACAVTAVRAYRTGGTGAAVNASVNNANVLLFDLSVSTADTWLSASPTPAKIMNEGDVLAVLVNGVSGSPTQLTIQIDINAGSA